VEQVAKEAIKSSPASSLKAAAEAVKQLQQQQTTSASVGKSEVTYDMLNTQQRQGVELARGGHSFCLIGSAGSGKTTTTRSIATVLTEAGVIGHLRESTERVLQEGNPSVAVLSFTNQAVRNIKEALPEEFKSNCSTFHTMLEYYPESFDVEAVDGDGHPTGEFTTSRRFIPRYGCEPGGNGDGNILPHLDVVIVEEAGSVPLDLFKTFMSALPNPDATTFIFLGDLNQLPPVFDDAILGFKLLELPIVELTEVYRNVGLVTQLAQRILTGKPIGDKEAAEWNRSDDSGTITMKPFTKRVEPDDATKALGTYFKRMVVAGEFDPAEDVLLIPFNKHLGTVEMNKWIGQGLAERDGLEVHQVTAGFLHHHFCIGDKVLHNKEYWFIDSIAANPLYTGQRPLPPSKHIDRWGRIDPDHETEVLAGTSFDFGSQDIDTLLDATVAATKGDGMQQQSSAVITLRNVENPQRTEEVKTTGAVNALLLLGAMTVHKAQGSEWKRVWCIFHHSHSVMLNRELLYTAVTRARKDLTVMYSGRNPLKAGDSALQKGILNQKLNGNTLDDKLEYYRNKVTAERVKAELAEKRKAMAS
jgi:energy-coupling factor transporter ATP-binding protein EcfA2